MASLLQVVVTWNEIISSSTIELHSFKNMEGRSVLHINQTRSGCRSLVLAKQMTADA